MSPTPKTSVYIDGFNLYFGALKKTPFRWLNIATMCRLLLPKNDICEIKYFTALVTPRAGDEQQPMRQQTYLRALKTLPNLSIVLGHFLTHEVNMPLAASKGPKFEYVRVIKTEEKGSDVNLAVHLLNDGYQNKYDMAVVVSNDSDLVEAIRIVTKQLHKGVGVLNPHKNPSRTLLAHATFFKTIRKGVLRVSQFEPALEDTNGRFHKPESW
ncbi:MAG: NYN domain-containing protein [Pseudomonadota bacterium]